MMTDWLVLHYILEYFSRYPVRTAVVIEFGFGKLLSYAARQDVTESFDDSKYSDG